MMRVAERGWYGATLLVAGILGVVTIRNPDIFWHLAAGHWMLENRALPTTDPLRFTAAGVEWVDHEWLFQVVAAAIERWGGLDLLALVRLLVLVGIAAVLFAGCRRSGSSPAISAAIVVAALAVVRTRLYLRPELATFVGLALLLTVLERVAGPQRQRWLAVGSVVIAVWANFHPGALVAPAVVGLYALGTRLGAEAWPWRVVIGAPAAAACLLLLNPFGVHIFAVPGAIAASLAGLDATNPDWAPGWVDPDPVAVLLALGWLAASASASRRRCVHAPTMLTAAALFGLGLLQARQQPLFAIGAAFALGRLLAGTTRRWQLPLAVGACVAALGWCVVGVPVWGRSAPQPGWGLEAGRYPERLVDSLASWPGLGNVYNDPVVGGYIAWRSDPPRQIFIDTRNELDPELLHRLGQARRDERAWRELLADFDIDGALVRYDRRPVPVYEADAQGRPVQSGTATIHQLLFPPGQFAVVGFDDRMMLLVRRTPERAERLARDEFVALHPEDLGGTLARAQADAAAAERLVAEIARQQSLDPNSQPAAWLAEGLRR